jgi:hypothetical protein
VADAINQQWLAQLLRAAGGILLGWRRPRIPVIWLLLTASFAVFGLMAVRNIPWFGLITMPVWGLTLTGSFSELEERATRPSAISGSPLLVLQAGAAWNRQITPPWQVLQTFFSEPLRYSYLHSPLDLLFALAFLVLTIATWRIVRPSYALYTTLLFSVMVSSGLLTSIMRYELVLFPAFLVLGAAMRNTWFRYAYMIAGLGLGVLFMETFARGFWVA